MTPVRTQARMGDHTKSAVPVKWVKGRIVRDLAGSKLPTGRLGCRVLMSHTAQQSNPARIHRLTAPLPLGATLALLLLAVTIGQNARALTPVSPVITLPKTQDTESSQEQSLEFARKLGLGYARVPGTRSLERRNDRGQDILFIADESEPPGWNISFQRLNSPEMGETASSRVDAFLESLKARGDSATVRSRSSLGIRLLGGKADDLFPAELVYLDIPLPDEQRGISGLLVVQTTPQTFLYGTLFALSDAFENGGSTLIAAVFDSLRIQPSISEEEVNSTRINNGASILQAFTPELIRSVARADIKEFYRIYTTNEAGEVTEVGWQQLTTQLAPLSALDGITTQERPDAEEGLLVSLKSEIVEFFPERQITIDIVSTHWLSLDRAECQWSTIRTPRRILEAGSNRTETEVGSPSAETGVRTRPQPRSTVTIVDSNGVTDRLDVPAAPDPYLSQAELYILGHLIRAAGLESFEADWYTMDREAQSGVAIRKRSDSFSKDDSTGNFRLDSLGGSGRFSRGIRHKRVPTAKKYPTRRRQDLILADRPRELVDLYQQKNLPIR